MRYRNRRRVERPCGRILRVIRIYVPRRCYAVYVSPTACRFRFAVEVCLVAQHIVAAKRRSVCRQVPVDCLRFRSVCRQYVYVYLLRRFGIYRQVRQYALIGNRKSVSTNQRRQCRTVYNRIRFHRNEIGCVDRYRRQCTAIIECRTANRKRRSIRSNRYGNYYRIIRKRSACNTNYVRFAVCAVIIRCGDNNIRYRCSFHKPHYRISSINKAIHQICRTVCCTILTHVFHVIVFKNRRCGFAIVIIIAIFCRQRVNRNFIAFRSARQGIRHCRRFHPCTVVDFDHVFVCARYRLPRYFLAVACQYRSCKKRCGCAHNFYRARRRNFINRCCHGCHSYRIRRIRCLISVGNDISSRCRPRNRFARKNSVFIYGRR